MPHRGNAPGIPPSSPRLPHRASPAVRTKRIARTPVALGMMSLGVVCATLDATASTRDARPGVTAEADSPEPTLADVVGVVRDALAGQRGQRPEALLAALRQLQDPALKPLFAQFADSQRPVLRIHGCLGLAELDPARRMDLLLVKNASDPRLRAVLLGEAVQRDLLTLEQLEDVARWADLDPTVRVLIMGRLDRAGVAIDPRPLRELATSDNIAIAVLAALQLVQINPGEPAPEAIDRVFSLKGAERTRALEVVLDHIRVQELTACRPVVERVLSDSAKDPLLSHHALRTLLWLDPTDAGAASRFKESCKQAESLGDRLRLAVMGLELSSAHVHAAASALPVRAARRPAPSLFDTLEKDESELVKAMARASAFAARLEPSVAASRSSGASPPPATAFLVPISKDGITALTDLVSHAYPPATQWSLELADRLSPEDAAAVQLAVIDSVTSRIDSGAGTDLVQAGVTAAAHLGRRSPTQLHARLLAAAKASDATLCRILLAGGLRAGPASGGVIVEGTSGVVWPDEAASAMHQILAANAAPSLSKDVHFPELARIALGRGKLLLPYRVQAAWLAMRASGEEHIALARVLAD